MRLLKLSLFLLLATSFSSAFASTLHVTFTLDKLVAKTVSERSGDELYCAITTLGQGDMHRHYRIPAKPHYWRSHDADKIRDVLLWEGDLASGQAIEVVVELAEHDVPPWNIDDFVGMARVKLQNRDGHLHYQWNKDTMTQQEAQGNAIATFDNAHGHYELHLGVTSNKS